MIRRVDESFKQDAARFVDSYVKYNTQNVRMRAMAASNGHSKHYFPTVPSL